MILRTSLFQRQKKTTKRALPLKN